GNPAAMPALAMVSASRNTYAGPEPDTAVTASIRASSLTHSTLPIAASRSDACLRWYAEICAFATATLTPRPIAAAVFGIARTIAVPKGNDFSRNPIVRPAIIESTSVDFSTYLARGCNVSGALCGFTAITTALAATALTFGLSLTPRRASPLTALPGCGSTTEICFGRRPRASQPSSIAPPILPAPTRTRVPRNFASVLTLRMAMADHRPYASPEVSNTAASSASCAVLPAQTTN